MKGNELTNIAAVTTERCVDEVLLELDYISQRTKEVLERSRKAESREAERHIALTFTPWTLCNDNK